MPRLASSHQKRGERHATRTLNSRESWGSAHSLFYPSPLKGPRHRLQKHIFSDASHGPFFNHNLPFETLDSHI